MTDGTVTRIVYRYTYRYTYLRSHEHKPKGIDKANETSQEPGVEGLVLRVTVTVGEREVGEYEVRYSTSAGGGWIITGLRCGTYRAVQEGVDGEAYDQWKTCDQ